MHNKGRFPNVMFGARLRPDSAALAIMVLLLFLIFVFLFLTVTAQPAEGQRFNVIYTFTNEPDWILPIDLRMDAAGELYGTTAEGGFTRDDCAPIGCGTDFKLWNRGSGWVLRPLYSFLGGTDGAHPLSGVSIGANGIFYGATEYGGGGYVDGGTVYSLRPIASASRCRAGSCLWTEIVLHRFLGGSDGLYPVSPVVFDRDGNIYGTTWLGGGSGNGGYGYGTVYKLSPSGSNWTETVLYSFTGGNDGGGPGGVIFDTVGNLYGTAGGGAAGCGTVFRLSPSGFGWTENTLYSFQCGSDGSGPSDLVFDQSGNLYGATYSGGSGGGGTVYELVRSSNGWTFTLLHSLSGAAGPVGRLTIDTAGNLYGTAREDGAYGWGSIFKLTPGSGGWTYTDLYDFAGGIDGGQPQGSVVLDGHGDLFGVTPWGGAGQGYSGYGVVWEITP